MPDAPAVTLDRSESKESQRLQQLSTAIDAIPAAFPEVGTGFDRDVAKGQLHAGFSTMYSPESLEHPFLWSDENKWQENEELLREYGLIDGTRSVDEYFTNEYIPAGENLFTGYSADN